MPLIFGLSTLSLVVLAKLDAVLLFLNERIYFDFVSNRGSDYVRTNLIKNGILFRKTFGFGTGAGILNTGWKTAPYIT